MPASSNKACLDIVLHQDSGIMNFLSGFYVLATVLTGTMGKEEQLTFMVPCYKVEKTPLPRNFSWLLSLFL